MVFKNFQRGLQTFKAGAQGFLNKLPSHVQKGQHFLNNFVKHAGTANRLIQHTARAVDENAMFGQKARDIANKTSTFSEAGLKKMSEIHGGINQFADKMRGFNPSPTV